ncbi:MAG: (d)CMP kinase [Bacteroidota bacterium]
MPHPITIAIDGFSGCGKSSLARTLAQRLGYRYVDTGAMYRAVTLYFIQHSIDLDDEQRIRSALEEIQIDFMRSSEYGEASNITLLNGQDVERDIRSLEVSQLVSPVATISAVRRAMVAQQRRMGSEGAVVMDGRDIGTVVFPHADLKLFLVADLEVRAQRRLMELQERGQSANLEEVIANLKERDRIDSSRSDSPLKKADDAIVIDNSKLTFEQLVERAMMEVERVMG